jgi:hypothetical protein
MPTCAECGNQLGADDRFCGRCGAEAPEPSAGFCRQCGDNVETGARFCGNCGAELQGNASAPAAPPPISAKRRRPNRLWPETLFGNLIYGAAFGGGGYFYYSFAGREDVTGSVGPEVAFLIGLISAFVIVTFWRNILISAGVFDAAPETTSAVDADGGGGSALSQTMKGAAVIALIVAGVGARQCHKQELLRNIQKPSFDKMLDDLQQPRTRDGQPISVNRVKQRHESTKQER